MPMTAERKWVTAKEAGKFFGIPLKTLYSLSSRHLLPPGSTLKLGRSVRFNLEVIEQGAEMRKEKR